MILIGASPNTEKEDLKLALLMMVKPWGWNNSLKVNQFEQYLSAEFSTPVLAFDSARSALYATLKTAKIGPGDEVILPAFICFVVANAVIAVGATPIYADIDANLNIDITEVKTKVTSNTKAIIAPHMFGAAINIPELRAAVGDDILIIEDIAHSLGGSFQNKRLGSFGDVAIVSFGMDKVISSVRGGALIINNQKLIPSLKTYQSTLPYLPRKFLARLLLSPIIWSVVQPTYNWGLGRFTLGKFILQFFKFAGISGNLAVQTNEANAMWPKNIPAQMSSVQAELGLSQLRRLQKFNHHRRRIAEIYFNNLGIPLPSDHERRTYLRFPIFAKSPLEVANQAKTLGIQIGRWYDNVLFTKPINWQSYSYKPGTAKISETVVKNIVNLPTGINITEQQASDLISKLKPYVAIRNS